MLPIYFINLDARPDRLDYMSGQLSSVCLSGQRIRATTESDLSISDIARYCAPALPTGGNAVELATSMSHRRAWKTLIESGAEHALILEDDVQLSRALPAILNDITGRTDVPDLVKFDATAQDLRLRPMGITFAGRFACERIYSSTFGCGGYLISRRLARKLLDTPRHLGRPIDVALFNPYGILHGTVTPYQVSPAPIVSLDVAGSPEAAARSDIEVSRQAARKDKTSLRSRLARAAQYLMIEQRLLRSKFMLYLVWRVPKYRVRFSPD